MTDAAGKAFGNAYMRASLDYYNITAPERLIDTDVWKRSARRMNQYLEAYKKSEAYTTGMLLSSYQEFWNNVG